MICLKPARFNRVILIFFPLIIGLVMPAQLRAGSFDESTACPYASHFYLYYPIGRPNPPTDLASVRRQCASYDADEKGKFCMLFRNDSDAHLLMRTSDFRAYTPAGHFTTLTHNPLRNAKKLDTLDLVIFNGGKKIREFTITNRAGIRCYNDSNHNSGISCAEIR